MTKDKTTGQPPPSGINSNEEAQGAGTDNGATNTEPYWDALDRYHREHPIEEFFAQAEHAMLAFWCAYSHHHGDACAEARQLEDMWSTVRSWGHDHLHVDVADGEVVGPVESHEAYLEGVRETARRVLAGKAVAS